MNELTRINMLLAARDIFFEAILKGYAGKEDGEGIEKIKSPDGYRTLTFTKSNFKVVDRYCVTPNSNRSAGTTTIFYENEPIWWMSYCGEYEKEAISFLKESLVVAYENNRFCGGRGVPHYTNGEYIYSNHISEVGFERFEGVEHIWTKDNLSVGYHKYFGMALI